MWSLAICCIIWPWRYLAEPRELQSVPLFLVWCKPRPTFQITRPLKTHNLKMDVIPNIFIPVCKSYSLWKNKIEIIHENMKTCISIIPFVCLCVPFCVCTFRFLFFPSLFISSQPKAGWPAVWRRFTQPCTCSARSPRRSFIRISTVVPSCRRWNNIVV